jgi:hypothetical protein
MSLSMLLSLASLGRGWMSIRIPAHQATVQTGTLQFQSADDYCTDGKWVFRGGLLLSLSSIDDVAVDNATLARWYLDQNWQVAVNRGVTRYRPRLTGRPVHPFWLNISIEPEVLLLASPNENVTRALKRYRLHLCPPTALLG